MNTRVVIGIALAVLGLIAVTGVGLLVAGDDRRLGATQDRSYVTGKFALEIGGVHAGFVNSVKGCGIGANVVNEQLGADKIVRKHISQPVYDPCVIEIGSSMGVPIYQWIADTLAQSYVRKNVTVIAADYNYTEKARTTLSDALITKVRFPALDAASKDAAYIQLTLEADAISKTAGSGAKIAPESGKATQKKWLPSNFRLSLNGLDASKVNKVSAFEIRQTVAQDDVGELRDYQKEPGKLEVGDLAVTTSTATRATWDTWFDDFVIKGNNAQANEKSGSLEFLSADLKGVLFKLSFQGVGIFRADDPPQEAGSETVARAVYSLYIEEASFDYLVSSSAASTAGGGTGTGTTTVLQTTTPPIQQVAAPIEAFITAVSANVLVDGETFTISDGVNEPTTFEFDLDGQAAGGIPVKIEKDAPPEVVADAIINAINGVADELQIVAKPAGPELKIQLQSERGAEAGEEKILEFVENESFTVRDAVPAKEGEGLAAPAELKATTGAAEGEIDLAWAASEGALGYIVAFRTEPEGEYIDLEKTEGTELTLAGLKSGVTHYFVVRATDGTNESKNSNESSAPAG